MLLNPEFLRMPGIRQILMGQATDSTSARERIMSTGDFNTPDKSNRIALSMCKDSGFHSPIRMTPQLHFTKYKDLGRVNDEMNEYISKRREPFPF